MLSGPDLQAPLASHARLIPLVLAVGCDTHGPCDRVCRDPPRAADRHLPAGAGYPCSRSPVHPRPALLPSVACDLAECVAVFLVSVFLAARLLPRQGSASTSNPSPSPPLTPQCPVKPESSALYGSGIPLFLLASCCPGRYVTHHSALSGCSPVCTLAADRPPTPSSSVLPSRLRGGPAVHVHGAPSPACRCSAIGTITLFVPCIAQFLVMQRSAGCHRWRSPIILPFAFAWISANLCVI